MSKIASREMYVMIGKDMEVVKAMASRASWMSAESAWRPHGKGAVLATKAVEHTTQRQCLSHEGSGNTQGKGSVLATKAVEHTTQRQCLSHEGSGTHNAKAVS